MNDPQSLAFTAVAAQSYPGVAQGRSQTIASLNQVTLDDVRGFLNRQIQTERLLVALAGDVSPQTTRALLDVLQERLPRGEVAADEPFLDIQNQGRTIVVPQPIPQSTVVMAMPGLARDDPDFLVAYVLNHIVGGGGFSSRLTDEIREKRGLAYSVASFLSPSAQTASFMVYFATRNDAVAEAIDIALAVLSDVAEHGVSEKELNDAKSNLMGSYALRFDSNGKIANHLMGVQISDLPVNYHEIRNDLVAEVTMDDVKRVAQRLLADIDPLIVVAGDPQNIEIDDTIAPASLF